MSCDATRRWRHWRRSSVRPGWQYFDEIAPMIRDRHGLEEVRGWFADESFTDVRRLVDEMELYLLARLS